MKCFFTVVNLHFGGPKTNLVVLKSQSKKKTKSSPHFPTFPHSNFNFPPSLLQFSFSSQFSPLFPFFLATFFPVGQQKFPGQKSLAGTLFPDPPACYTTGNHINTFLTDDRISFNVVFWALFNNKDSKSKWEFVNS